MTDTPTTTLPPPPYVARPRRRVSAGGDWRIAVMIIGGMALFGASARASARPAPHRARSPRRSPSWARAVSVQYPRGGSADRDSDSQPAAPAGWRDHAR